MISKLLKALRTDPAGFPRRAASAVAERARLLAFRHAPGGKDYCVHYGVHRNGNAGDMALFTATRRLFDHQMGRQDWRMLPVRAPVGARDISRINAEAKAVLGGRRRADHSRLRAGQPVRLAIKSCDRGSAPAGTATGAERGGI